MPGPSLHRQPSRIEKVLIALLAIYALTVIVPDTFRAVFKAPSDQGLFKWYPIATLGFEADNNGKVVSVESGGPADGTLHVGDVVDLTSVKPDRRPINIYVYVEHASTYTMHVIAGPDASREVSITASDEQMVGKSTAALLFAQGAALFFIVLCVYLVWHSATWATWGFFLYGTWFNSGQYFVWYANLPSAALGVFDGLQVLAQALGLTEFLAFAMHFPEEDLPHWTPARRVLLLAGVFSILLVTGASSFLNYVLAWKTEAAYVVYYCFTFVVYFLVAVFFVHNFRRLPEQRPRMAWIMAAGLIGLPCFLVADLIEATSFAQHLPFGLAAWIESNDWVLNVMYGMNVLVPAAVVYTALHHEVMSVRFGITRAVILSVVFGASVAALDVAMKLPFEALRDETWAIDATTVIISFAVAVTLALIHNPLHVMVDRVIWPRWYRARVQLRNLAERLINDDTLRKPDVDRALVEQASTSLWLRYAALFRRQSEDTFALDQRWPDDATCQLKGDDPWLRCLAADPMPLADPDEAPSAPELAVPVQYARRAPVNRVVLYGHHESNVRIDPDEIRLLREVSRAAAIAYMRLDLEDTVNSAREAPAITARPQ